MACVTTDLNTMKIDYRGFVISIGKEQLRSRTWHVSKHGEIVETGMSAFGDQSIFRRAVAAAQSAVDRRLGD